MEVFFRSKSLAETCKKFKKLARKCGEGDAHLILQRLSEILAAETLADLKKLPGARCHPLKGDLKGKFAVNLNNPYRLIFEPANDPIPKLDDGAIDMANVTEVVIVKLKVDYHGN
jgi:proteic killer suppression protein